MHAAPETAAMLDLAKLLLGLMGLVTVVGGVLHIAVAVKKLRARDPLSELITKVDFDGGLKKLKEDFDKAAADLKAEIAGLREYARDSVHALREKAHAQEVATAVLQKALDNGLKYRVEQLEERLARLEQPAPAHVRAPGSATKT